jgi:hypothetical protein
LKRNGSGYGPTWGAPLDRGWGSMSPYPDWLDALAWFSLGLSFLCGLIILGHEFKRPQKMFIMDLVWPITALYWSVAALWGHFKIGQRMTKDQAGQHLQDSDGNGGSHEPSRSETAVAVSHCGAGCTLGDIIAESLAGGFAFTFAGGAFPTRLVLDFLLAWFLGVIFQYFTIVPMRGLSPGRGVLAAIRADTFSIVTFQMGLFGWMALSYYVIFPKPHLRPNEALFWFMMQIGMVIGFFSSYPANLFLLRRGWKEKMG